MEVDKQCPLLSLSTDLVFQVLDYLPPSVNLALTCSTLYQQCRSLLDLHRAAHARYKITSDLDPETVINLLKRTTSAKVARWHVRELEIWGSRQGWQDWRPWAPELSGLQLAEAPPTRSELEAGDLQRYIQAGNEWWEFSGSEIDEVRRELQSGQDAYLKSLLIASCPRLHSIRIARRDPDLGSALKRVTKAINSSRLLEKWPPGFRSLRNIAVNVEMGFPSDKDENDDEADDGDDLREDQVNAVDLVALLCLPSIESIYFNGLWHNSWAEEEQGIDYGEKYDFPENTSSVKHVFLDGISCMSVDLLCSIAGAPKSLESMAIRTVGDLVRHIDDIDAFVVKLAECHPGLQELIIYNPSGIFSSRCMVYSPHKLEDFESLKRINIAAADLELEWLILLTCAERMHYAERFSEYLTYIFPLSIEALYIWGKSDQVVDPPDPKKPSDTLDSAVAHLIESSKFKNLKVIYLEDVERAQGRCDYVVAQETPIVASRKELAFQKSVAAGHKVGVHVQTLMNRDDGSNYWRNFPARPDKFALKTGCFGERPLEWKFNLQTGDWGEDCHGCGECRECLVVYPPELWKSAMRS
ncbi:hypothetical protein FGRMN_8451 [Fusarium graminum]|nr:hypothetical protein FGRMN_8451 [Fusarium graminum]